MQGGPVEAVFARRVTAVNERRLALLDDGNDGDDRRLRRGQHPAAPRSAAAPASSVDATLKYAGGVGGDRHAAEVADVARRHHHRPRDVTGATRG
jgi:hypothetical protein